MIPVEKIEPMGGGARTVVSRYYVGRTTYIYYSDGSLDQSTADRIDVDTTRALQNGWISPFVAVPRMSFWEKVESFYFDHGFFHYLFKALVSIAILVFIVVFIVSLLSNG